MARTKTVLGAGARLADFISASLMACVVPPQAVHEVLNAHGRNSQRIRAFPAVAGVYYVMALSLYPEASYEAVFSAVSQGLAWEAGAPQPAGVSKVAIRLLRSRIGAQPLADLVSRCCAPLADPAVHPAGFYRGLRLVAYDELKTHLQPQFAAHGQTTKLAAHGVSVGCAEARAYRLHTTGCWAYARSTAWSDTPAKGMVKGATGWFFRHPN